MHPILFLCLFAAACFAIGAIIHRGFFTTVIPDPLTFDIGDLPLARIAYEAKRAYYAAQGVMLKSWNNLTPEKRNRFTAQVSAIRNGADAYIDGIESGLIVAIARLAHPKPPSNG